MMMREKTKRGKEEKRREREGGREKGSSKIVGDMNMVIGNDNEIRPLSSPTAILIKTRN